MIKKILLIDDSPVFRKIIKSCIPKDRGYEFFEAGDGLVGFETYKQIRPDLTFMDMTMPVMDGFEATAKIIEFDQEAIIIACTADIQIKAMTTILGLGAFMLIKKPPTKEIVEDALLKAERRIG